MLAALALPAWGNAKTSSRQLSCLNNLRQLGIAERGYVTDNRAYTGSYSPSHNCYVWPTRLLGYTGGNRNVFSCPAAIPTSRWDTNLNNTLGGSSETGDIDIYAVTPNSRFSYGINDWGLSLSANPQLGLGGDIDGGFRGSAVTDHEVVVPSQMIMLGDTPPAASLSMTYWEANLDPTQQEQWPSNRHQYLTDLVFADGHTETPLRSDVINSATNSPWRSRWNNDNKPHNEFTWSSSPANAPLDPSY